MSRVRAQMLRLSEILGIQSIEIAPGDITIIDGKNAAGKTSILDGLKAICGTGKDATLKRSGAVKGEAVLVLSDGMVATQKLDPSRKDGGEFSLVHPEFGPLKSPRSRFDKLIDMVSLDPQRFMSTTDDDRLGLLTEAAGIELPAEEIEGACQGVGVDLVREITSSVSGLNPLDMIAHVRKSLGAIRLQRNKIAKEKRASVIQLEPTLTGMALDKDWIEVERQERSRHIDLKLKLEENLRSITGSRDKVVQAAATAYLEGRTEKRREADVRIQVIEQEFQTACQDLQDARDVKVASARSTAETRIKEERATLEPQIDECLQSAMAAQANADRLRAEQQTSAFIDQLRTDAAAEEEYSLKLTAALDELDKLKCGLLKDVPIPGLDIIDGVIHMDQVPFKRLNRQKQMGICIEVAKLRARDVGLAMVVIDNLECLDSEHFEEFIDQALATDLQWVVGRVSDQPGVNVRVVNACDRKVA